MDGDCAPIPELKKLCQSAGALLLVDDAHASGVYGPRGEGLCVPDSDETIVTGTFSKGLGSYGAYVLCSEAWREDLINSCPGLIYSTALPPAVLASMHAAIQITPTLTEERRHLGQLSARLRSGLRDLGFEALSSSQIQPVMIGDSHTAVALQESLRQAGLWLSAIRPPTVPPGGSRLRITLTAEHSVQDVDTLLMHLEMWR